MNFLGHLFFSNDNIELMYANLFGDSIKGKDLSIYNETIQRGIRLHRHIDSYIDTHPVVIELLHDLYEPLPKIAGIAVDLYFDHLLAKKWDEFHNEPLESFLDKFHDYPINLTPFNSPEFEVFISKLKKARWIYYYKSEEGLEKACEGISNRISFPNSLAHAPLVFKEKEKEIEHAFYSFMKEAIPHFNQYFQS